MYFCLPEEDVCFGEECPGYCLKKQMFFMYSFLLIAHSYCRWLVLAALCLSLMRAIYGWISRSFFTKTDNHIRHWTATIVHIQLLLGLGLYVISPLVRYFYEAFSVAVHERQPRFFGMEHIAVMLLAVVIITIGSVKVKRGMTDRDKFRKMTLWFGTGLFLILTSIPWSFSPLISRPSFRVFW